MKKYQTVIKSRAFVDSPNKVEERFRATLSTHPTLSFTVDSVSTRELSDENDRLRAASGSVDSSDPLVSFLYTLMRDHLPAGAVESLVRSSFPQEVQFTNGWLAQIAQDQAKRLREG